MDDSPPSDKTIPTDLDPNLAAFVALIDRLSGFDDSLDAEWVDGFLTALVAGPRVYQPSEWLPAVFGDAFDRAFGDPADLEAAMATLSARWNDIASSLNPEVLVADTEHLHLSPLMSEYDDDARAKAVADGGLDPMDVADQLQTGVLWAAGFMDGVDAFRADWRPPRKDREAAEWLADALVQVAAVQASQADLKEHLARVDPSGQLNRDDLIDEALFTVQDLRLFWIEHGHKPAPRRAAEQPGRNEPCHCGSGRKYKLCHGAAT